MLGREFKTQGTILPKQERSTFSIVNIFSFLRYIQFDCVFVYAIFVDLPGSWWSCPSCREGEMVHKHQNHGKLHLLVTERTELCFGASSYRKLTAKEMSRGSFSRCRSHVNQVIQLEMFKRMTRSLFYQQQVVHKKFYAFFQEMETLAVSSKICYWFLLNRCGRTTMEPLWTVILVFVLSWKLSKVILFPSGELAYNALIYVQLRDWYLLVCTFFFFHAVSSGGVRSWLATGRRGMVSLNKKFISPRDGWSY